MGLLNTIRSIRRKSLHVDEISSKSPAYIKTLHIISLTHSYLKENQREHCRRIAWLDFCRSCLQLMTSRNTAVFRYHGIFETVY